MLRSLVLAALATCASFASAQIDTKADPDQAAMLRSANPTLRANKRLVYDFWRTVFEGGHLELADKYMAPDYRQHNPTVATGRAAFVKFFGQFMKPHPVAPRITAPLVSIVAERDLVVLVFASPQKDPAHPGKTYVTTWFDMFRIRDGKIAEHWDPATKGR